MLVCNLAAYNDLMFCDVKRFTCHQNFKVAPLHLHGCIFFKEKCCVKQHCFKLLKYCFFF